MRVVVVAVAAMVLSGCGAGFARLGTYGSELADAKTRVGNREYSLYVHPTDDTILVQRGFGAAMGQSVVEGATFGAVSMQEPKPIWKAAAEWLASPLHCTITDIYELERISWEAPYSCPPGVSLREAVMKNRATLREGVPLPTAQ